VIVLLVGAAIVGIRNIQSIQANANSLVRSNRSPNRLIDELHSQQTALSEVFSVWRGIPDSVDYYRIMTSWRRPTGDIARHLREGGRTAEHDLWQRLNRSSLIFRRGACACSPSRNPRLSPRLILFRFHGRYERGGAPAGSRVSKAE